MTVFVRDPLVVVSGDSHAGMPIELWPEYLDPRYHDLLPKVREEAEICPAALFLINARNGAHSLAEYTEAHRTGWHGLHDPVLRLADMDREGVAAEVVYHGDSRLHDLFFSATNRPYSFEAWHAGSQAWNRWAADTFGIARDRFLLTASIGPCVDMDAVVAELEWIADHGFVATYAPGYTRHRDLPPLFDPFWEPFWSTCEARGLAVVVHAGFGSEQGELFVQLQRVYDDVAAAAGSTELDAMLGHADAIASESKAFIVEVANHSVLARRPLWQLVLGGVFDRHPDLRLVLSEVRVDWIPATLRHLDAVYETHRADLPARRTPSEYWSTNCLAVASFIHRAEVGMRHEIGMERIAFGRDYPHSEGTWPHTKQWCNDAFFGVPEGELRLVLGENLIRFLGLDRDRLVDIARRVGPTFEEIGGVEPALPAELIDNFARRGGYLKPIEGDSRIPSIEPLVRDDVARASAR